MAVDDADRLWYVETGVQPNRLVGFDPKSERFAFQQDVGEARANTIRHMYFHPPTRELWYGADQNTIGRVKIPPARALVP
jgi:virginiamycin B lyase